MRLPTGWRYRFGPIAAAAFLIMLGVVFWWGHWKVFGTLLGLAGAAVSLLDTVWRGGQRLAEAVVAESDPRQVDKAREHLAEKVGEHWRWEAKARGLDDSVPPPVRWRLATPSTTDHVRQVTVGGRVLFRGGVEAVGELAARFRELQPRRLVILGEAGMGKTTLATLLLLELLRELPQSGGPVPLMVPLSGWDPRFGEDFRAWLARRLEADFPSLGVSQYYGPTAAKSLVDRGRVLPVLDGLDELPDTARLQALEAIDAALTRDDAVILTCRTAEYLEACSALPRGVFSDTAVITPERLTPADAVGYLNACLERVLRGQDHPDPAWPPVLARLAAGAAPLWPALSTPLALWLVDRVYIRSRNGEDPTGLCRLPTPQAVTEHLLDALTGAVISANPAVGRRHDRRDPLPLFRPRGGWDPEAAQRWLGYLAHHLDRLHSRDLAWWQLQRAVGASALRLPLAFSVGLAVGLVVSLIGGPGAGAAAGLLTGTLLYAGSFLDATRLQMDRPLNSQPLGRGIVAGLFCGFMCGVAAGALVGGGLAGRVVAGCVVGSLVGIAVRSVSVRLPPAPGLPPDAGLPLRARLRLRTRRLANGLGLGFAYGLVAGLILGLALAISSGTVSSFVLGLGVGLGIGLVVGLAGEDTPTTPQTGRKRPRPWTLTGIAHRLRPPKDQPPASYAGLPLRARVRLLGGRLAGGLAYGLPFGAAFGLVLGLGLGLILLIVGSTPRLLVVGLSVGLTYGLVWAFYEAMELGLGEKKIGLGIAHALRPRPDQPPPSYVGLPLRARVRLLGGRLAGGLAYGLPFGAAFGLVLGLVAWGLAVGLAVGIGYGLGWEVVLGRVFLAALVSLGVALVYGLVFGVVWGFVKGCKAGLGEGLVRGIVHALRSPNKHVPPAEPVLPYADLQFRGRGQLFVRFLVRFLLRLMPPAFWGFILLACVALGLWVGLTGGGVASGAAVGLGVPAISLLGILVLSFPSVLIAWAATPAPARPGITPDSVLRGDRGLSVLIVTWYGVILVALASLVGGSAMGAARGFAVALCLGIFWLLFVAGGAWFVNRDEPEGLAWPAYFVTLIWLAAHRKLPLRLMAFLTDAHRLGLLGQVGAVYQFRHSSYQDRLARTYEETGKNRVRAATGHA